MHCVRLDYPWLQFSTKTTNIFVERSIRLRIFTIPNDSSYNRQYDMLVCNSLYVLYVHMLPCSRKV